eukprot:TRINITY_DN7718_c0_g2_i1.p1 TRINITY_DN7718_c0_g2~~TRINITY_DN7718_c0_g2_i1.p1  ORF type:complete len:332 (+),score=64.90 TRINITY_DN7718_c0_g2_i1:78-1073(+)
MPSPRAGGSPRGPPPPAAFCCEITKVNRRGKRQQRTLLLTHQTGAVPGAGGTVGPCIVVADGDGVVTRFLGAHAVQRIFRARLGGAGVMQVLLQCEGEHDMVFEFTPTTGASAEDALRFCQLVAAARGNPPEFDTEVRATDADGLWRQARFNKPQGYSRPEERLKERIKSGRSPSPSPRSGSPGSPGSPGSAARQATYPQSLQPAGGGAPPAAVPQGSRHLQPPPNVQPLRPGGSAPPQPAPAQPAGGPCGGYQQPAGGPYGGYQQPAAAPYSEQLAAPSQHSPPPLPLGSGHAAAPHVHPASPYSSASPRSPTTRVVHISDFFSTLPPDG